MAGHSKFKNIQYRKGAQDKRRAKLFAKISKEITVAAKLGLPDPGSNPRLRSAISLARSQNMPKDNIERAIKKSSDEDSETYEEVRYEGFGASGVGVIVETLTDNKNRTASNLRTLFQKNGGGLGTQGSASHNFKQIGIIKIDKEKIIEDKIFELAIEAGANECYSNNEFHQIHTYKNEIYDVKKKLESDISDFISTDIEWVPINYVNLKNDEKDNMVKFLEVLDDNEDVQNIFTNAKFEI